MYTFEVFNLYQYKDNILFTFFCFEHDYKLDGTYTIRFGSCNEKIKFSEFLYLEDFKYRFDNNQFINYRWHNLNPDEIIIIGNYNLNVIDLFHWEIKTKISLSNDLVNNCYYLSDYGCFITFLDKKISEQNEEFDIYIKSIKNSNSIIFKTLFNFEKGRIYYFYKNDDKKNGLNLYFLNIINNKIELEIE